MNDLELDNFYFDEDSIIKEQMSSLNLSSLTGGKQLRSRLVELIGNAHQLGQKESVLLGRIVEMVHNATLTHDDVIDNSHTRRDAPSVPQQINNKKSVLLGDYMLARALHELSSFKNTELTSELTLTLKDLVEGEWIQFENTNPFEIRMATYELLARKKTGSLFRWCFLAPYLASSENHELKDLYTEFGEQLGVIFQMSDDLIDFNPESKKSYGLDLINNNINFVLHFVGENYPELKRNFLQADQIESLTNEESEALNSSLNQAKHELHKKCQYCDDLLSQIAKKLKDQDDYIGELKSIIDLLRDRIF